MGTIFVPMTHDPVPITCLFILDNTPFQRYREQYGPITAGVLKSVIKREVK